MNPELVEALAYSFKRLHATVDYVAGCIENGQVIDAIMAIAQISCFTEPNGVFAALVANVDAEVPITVIMLSTDERIALIDECYARYSDYMELRGIEIIQGEILS